MKIDARGGWGVYEKEAYIRRWFQKRIGTVALSCGGQSVYQGFCDHQCRLLRRYGLDFNFGICLKTFRELTHRL